MNALARTRRIEEIRRILATDDVARAMKIEGDVHIMNVKRFFNKLVEKSHPLRDAVKAVVFGQTGPFGWQLPKCIW